MIFIILLVLFILTAIVCFVIGVDCLENNRKLGIMLLIFVPVIIFLIFVIERCEHEYNKAGNSFPHTIISTSIKYEDIDKLNKVLQSNYKNKSLLNLKYRYGGVNEVSFVTYKYRKEFLYYRDDVDSIFIYTKK